MSAERRCRDFLARAERRDPGNPFVVSCRRQFESGWFLSAAQLGALSRVTPTRGVRGMAQRMYGPGPRGAAAPASAFATAGDADSQATLEGVQEAYEAGRASWEDVCDAAHDQDWGGNSQSWDWSGGD